MFGSFSPSASLIPFLLLSLAFVANWLDVMACFRCRSQGTQGHAGHAGRTICSMAQPRKDKIEKTANALTEKAKDECQNPRVTF
jgi:hypothetical protein